MATQQFSDPIGAGIQLGRTRWAESAKVDVVETAKLAEPVATGLLRSSAATTATAQWSSRAVELFAELVTIGSFERAARQEPRIRPAEIAGFAEWVKKILNDWTRD